jgi:hypothetical protein
MILILIDDGWPSAILLGHELTRRGHRVHRLATRWMDPVCIRGLASQSRVPPPGSDEFLPAVERAMARTGAEVVIPLFEPALYRFWDAGPRWAPQIFPRIDPWQQALVRSKGGLGEFVAGLGVATPKQRWLSAPGDLGAACDEIGLPLVIKGDTGLGGDRVRVARTRAAAEEAECELRKERDEALVAQEFVTGATWMIGGLFRDGEPLRLYVGEKLALDPPERGPAVLVRSSDTPELAAAGRAVFAGLRWTGLAHADFIRDPSGGFRFLEVNPRPWGSLTSAAEAGIELFGPFTRLLEGGEVSPDLRMTAGVVSVIGPWRLRSQARRGTLPGLVAMLRDRGAWHSLNHFRMGVRVHLTIRMLIIWGGNVMRRWKGTDGH